MDNLYFLAIIPDEELCERVVATQQYIAAKYHSRTSLKVVPHITLKAPFKTPEFLHADVLHWFKNLRLEETDFLLAIENFGAFANPRHPVIYLAPVSNHSLSKIQRELIGQFALHFPLMPLQNTDIIFKPHMTVAYRDLAPAIFPDAWEEFSVKQFSASVKVDKISLLQHDGKKWNVIANCDLPAKV